MGFLTDQAGNVYWRFDVRGDGLLIFMAFAAMSGGEAIAALRLSACIGYLSTPVLPFLIPPVILNEVKDLLWFFRR